MVIQDMPAMSPRVPLPNADQQAEFERQLDILINEHLSYTSIVTWVSRPRRGTDRAARLPCLETSAMS